MASEHWRAVCCRRKRHTRLVPEYVKSAVFNGWQMQSPCSGTSIFFHVVLFLNFSIDLWVFLYVSQQCGGREIHLAGPDFVIGNV